MLLKLKLLGLKPYRGIRFFFLFYTNFTHHLTFEPLRSETWNWLKKKKSFSWAYWSVLLFCVSRMFLADILLTITIRCTVIQSTRGFRSNATIHAVFYILKKRLRVRPSESNVYLLYFWGEKNLKDFQGNYEIK